MSKKKSTLMRVDRAFLDDIKNTFPDVAPGTIFKMSYRTSPFAIEGALRKSKRKR